MAEAILTQARLKELLHYDPDTGVFTWRVATGSRSRAGSIAGCLNNQRGYLVIGVVSRTYYAHRLAWLYVHGRIPDDGVDHINRCRLDNRIANLRPATNAENQQNRGVGVNSTSGVTGVSFYKRTGMWRAHITVSGKNVHLGYFADKDKAAKARLDAKSKYHQFHCEE